MIDFTTLVSLAYRRERVEARRLAQRDGLSEHAALFQVMDGVLASRRLEQQRMAAGQVRKQQEKLAQRLAKKSISDADASAWQGWFDGSTHPNPGKMGIGGVLRGPDGECVEISFAAGIGDSNEAEYRALIALLEAALKVAPEVLVIHGDSRVVIDDVSHDGAGASGLQAHRAIAKRLLATLGKVTLRWVPRARNGAADLLSQKAVRL